MNTLTNIVALFDFDGVIMDTESQYTVFWNKMGIEYLKTENFGPGIKGQSMTQIYQRYFNGMTREQTEISEKLHRFEKEMSYEYIPGVVDFISELRRNGVKTAIVTSSDESKMAVIYDVHPELKSMTDLILTSERFTRSKPAPDCFLLGMKLLGGKPEETYVFEDSFHGLQAGTDSGAMVIGLSTTNSAESIKDKSNYVIADFKEMSYDKLLLIKPYE